MTNALISLSFTTAYYSWSKVVRLCLSSVLQHHVSHVFHCHPWSLVVSVGVGDCLSQHQDLLYSLFLGQCFFGPRSPRIFIGWKADKFAWS